MGPHKPLTEEQCTGARDKPHLKESRGGSADTPLERVPQAVQSLASTMTNYDVFKVPDILSRELCLFNHIKCI